jgi:3D (Asp-Asp-Asp) domain-containing protein/septal ring factor EnvC (AmiA/AmiB activator)
LVLLALTVIPVLAAPAVGGADPTRSTASLHARDAQLVAKSRAAVLSVYSLDQHLATARSHLVSLDSETRALQAQRATLSHALTVARHSSGLAQQHLAAQLRLLYEQGDVEPLEILFGSKSLDDALTSLDNLNGVAAQDEAILRELAATRARYRTAAKALAARALILAAARREAATTASRLAQTRSARTSYIGSLAAARRLTERQIATLVARAQAAQVRSRRIARTPVAATVSAPVPTSAVLTGHTITVTATGYSLGGSTSTGLPVGWGVAAVDPAVIALGSHMTVPGYGEAVAADTGGSIVGATIDLWFPSVAEAMAWGRRVVTIVVR